MSTSPRAKHTDDEAAALARALLERPHVPGYLDGWARMLTRELFHAGGEAQRVAIVFRLGEDLLALDVGCVREVHRPRRVHRVPGRTNEVFRGLVCLRGELVPAADLHALLGAVRPQAASPVARTVLVDRDGAAWAFEVDELLEVKRYHPERVAAPQVTVAKSAVHFTDGLLELGGGRHAARLDAARLFLGLSRSLS